MDRRGFHRICGTRIGLIHGEGEGKKARGKGDAGKDPIRNGVSIQTRYDLAMDTLRFSKGAGRCVPIRS
ncbi:MAG: hypothetical protein RBG13Loki_2924 [Promethearchaeota archaeon CR_4]|nr:MAG: hypothetical protein RBG13Loki_2924 [Candidatus Lokiarchaeota archaeon CR_4]